MRYARLIVLYHFSPDLRENRCISLYASVFSDIHLQMVRMKMKMKLVVEKAKSPQNFTWLVLKIAFFVNHSLQ